ncbi:MAG: 16S rRNA (guanine(966)-N(2))-methyltransferase RsmD [Candidatus Binataceae bacterium]
MRVIAGQAHGRRIAAPRGLTTRPATARVRSSIFSRLAARCELEGMRVLDIFAGSGSLGLEALSRGAAHVTFIDSSRVAAQVIANNLRLLGLTDRGRIVSAEVRRALRELAAGGERFDLVFVDAPFKADISAAILALLERSGLSEERSWVVVRQFHRAPALTQAGFEAVNIATLGDHRIALYRRLETPKRA